MSGRSRVFFYAQECERKKRSAVLSCFALRCSVLPRDGNSRIVSFGSFQIDLQAEELYRNGLRIRLQKQPFQILSLLIRRPGELITRDQLQAELWPSNTFVDFEHSLNAAVKRLREALGDNTQSARYLETVPRKGYRFVAPVTPEAESRVTGGNPLRRHQRSTYLIAGLVVLLACTVGIVRRALLFRLRSEKTEVGITNQGTSPPPMPVRKERGASPAGTYLDSCRDEVVQGRTLTAVCQKLSGTWQTTTLQDLGQCDGDIWNVDGYLSCDLRKNLFELPDPDLDPNRYYTHLTRAEKLEQDGAYEAAIREYKQALDVSSPLQAHCDRFWLAHAYAASGDRVVATKIIKDATASSPQEPPSYCVAQGYAQLNSEEALKWLERALHEQDPRMRFLYGDWRFASLHSNSKFQKLAELNGPAMAPRK